MPLNSVIQNHAPASGSLFHIYQKIQHHACGLPLHSNSCQNSPMQVTSSSACFKVSRVFWLWWTFHSPCLNPSNPKLHMCCVLSHSVMSDSFQPHVLQPTRLLCPWGFSRQEYWSELPCPLPEDLPNSGIKLRSPTLQMDSLLTEPPGNPKNPGVGSISLLEANSWPRNQTQISCIAGIFFTSWAMREAQNYTWELFHLWSFQL